MGSFISGDNFLYEFVDQHPRLCVRRSRYTNDPYVIARNDNVVSVNASCKLTSPARSAPNPSAPSSTRAPAAPRTLPGAPTTPRGAGPFWPRAPPPEGDPLPHRPHPGPGGRCLGVPEPHRPGGHGIRRSQAPPADGEAAVENLIAVAHRTSAPSCGGRRKKYLYY